MRLIDESTLKKSIEKWLNPDPNADRMVNIDDIAVSVMMEIEEQPTAYDVDKVVAELEKRAEEFAWGVSEFQDGYYAGIKDGFRQAIQIVKGGFLDAQENNKGLDAEEADAY